MRQVPIAWQQAGPGVIGLVDGETGIQLDADALARPVNPAPGKCLLFQHLHRPKTYFRNGPHNFVFFFMLMIAMMTMMP